MQCSVPPPLSDDQLSAVLDDEGDTETLEHLAHCPACRQRLETLRQFENSLESQLFRFECPSAQELSDYALAMLDAETSERIKQHVESCPRCQQELTMLDAFLSEAPETQSEAPNETILRPPRYLWRAARVEVSGSLALRGMSGEATHDAKAGSASLFLEAHAEANGILLTGQVVDSEVDWRGAIAEMRQGDSAPEIRRLDDLCEFSFELTDTSPLSLYVTAMSGIVLALEQFIIST